MAAHVLGRVFVTLLDLGFPEEATNAMTYIELRTVIRTLVYNDGMVIDYP
jgi:hypothetical protein